MARESEMMRAQQQQQQQQQHPRPLVVVNPRSGGGVAARALGHVRAVLERKLGAVDVAFTERAGHAIDIARDAAEQGRPLVVAVGGDGTLHEVANGVLDARDGARDRVSVGYVGQGTGGDFRRTLGIEHRLDAYIDAIASGRQRRVDAGKLLYRAPDGSERTRWFVNILSAGMGGLVDRYVADTPKALGGTAAYLAASVRALVSCRRARVRCDSTLGGERNARTLDSFMIAVCNGRYFGSGMHVAPMAKPDDGQFEVVSMDAPGKIAFAAFSRRIYAGRHLSSPGVVHFACDAVDLDLEERQRDRRATEAARAVFLLDVDGEPLGGLPLRVQLVRSALALRA